MNADPAASDPGRPAPLSGALIVIAIALAAGYGGACWLESRGRETWTGHLHAHATPAVAPANVRIREIIAEEGVSIEPGQPLALLADEEIEQEIAVQESLVTDLENELDQERARADVELAWRDRELNAELHAARLDSARFLQAQFDHRMQVQAWRDYLSGSMIAGRITQHEFIATLLRDSRLSDEGRLRALLEEEAARNALEVATTQIQLCDRRVRELESLKQKLPGSVARACGVDRLEAQLAEATDRLKSLEKKAAEITVVAPAYGKVGVYRKQPGEQAASGETLVEILDTDRRCVAVQVPSSSLTYLAAGKPVELRFPGGKRRAGTIRALPPQTSLACDGDALVTLRIDPAGKLWPEVPVGSAVDVTVRQ